jgi:very-short-patch-repair endonuclease
MKKINFKKAAGKELNKAKKQARNPFGSGQDLKKKASKMSTKMTKPEREMNQILKELKVEFEPQKVVGFKIYDFYVPQANLLIEVDGDYFHANPEVYTEGDLNSMQKRNVKNDVFKDTLASGRGYNLIRVWESDLANKYEEVKSNIKKELGL